MEEQKDNEKSGRGCIIPALLLVLFIYQLNQVDKDLLGEVGYGWLLFIGIAAAFYFWKESN